MKGKLAFAFILGLFSATDAFSGDISRDVRSASEVPLTENGGYFELGLGAIFHNNPIEHSDYFNEDTSATWTLNVNGEYRYNGFFVEASESSFDGINLGYTLWNNDSWQLDILGASLHGISQADNEIKDTDSEEIRNTKILERDTLFTGAGLRLTGFLEDTIIQYRLVSDIYSDNGIISTLRFGKHWQVRNWNFFGILGGEYRSSEANQFWAGVTEQMATERFPEYKSGDSVAFQAEMGAVYPLSEHWIFRASARYLQYPREVSESPLMKEDHLSLFQTSFTYVF